LSQSLRSSPEEIRKITGRLAALGAVNELLTRSAAHKADLREMLSGELRPHKAANTVIQGQALALDPTLARALALMFHELAENAAIRGPPARPQGPPNGSWPTRGGKIHITGNEPKGPPITARSQPGFGTELIGHILDPYEGETRMDFRREGLSCEIRVPYA